MILTVTCNPAIDVTYHVDDLVPGGVHRVLEVRQQPGGKGVNAARVLYQLGEDVVALGLADAGFGRSVEELGVAADFLDVLPSVRRTVVVQHGATTTSLWEPGGPVADSAAESLTNLVGRRVGEADALIVSGSLPPGLDPGLPVRLAAVAAAAGVPTLLDLDDEPLALALARGGSVLTPNRDELARLLPGAGRLDLVEAARALADRNRAPVVLTLGEYGVLAATDSACWRACLPEPVVGNPTGAGDATAAGLVRGLAAGMGWPELLGQAAALGAAAVLAPVAGEVDLSAYHEFTTRVRVGPIHSLTIGAHG